MTNLNEEKETINVEENTMTTDDDSPSFDDKKVNVVENNEANLVEPITMTPKAPPPPCPPPPPPPPPFEGFQFDESEHHEEKVDNEDNEEKEEEHGGKVTMTGAQSSDINEDDMLGITMVEKTEDDVAATEGVLLDLTQSPSEENEGHNMQENELLNLSAAPPLDDSNDAAENQEEDSNEGGERRGWGLFRRISSRNPSTVNSSGTANSATTENDDDDKEATSEQTSEKESRRQKQQKQQQKEGNNRRRRRWGLGQIQSNNSDSDDDDDDGNNHVCNLDNDREVEEDYDGVVVDENDGSDEEGVKKTVVLDGGGLRIIEHSDEDSDEDDSDDKGGDAAPQPRNWLRWRSNRQVNNSNDNDNDNDSDDDDSDDDNSDDDGDESTEEEEEDKNKEAEGPEKEEDQLLNRKDGSRPQPQRRYWSFRRNARQSQQQENDHDDYDGDDKALLKTNDDDHGESNKQYSGSYSDDVKDKNNEQMKSDDQNFVEQKDLLDSTDGSGYDGSNTNNGEVSAAASPAPVVRRGFFGLRRYQDGPNVPEDGNEVKEVNNNDQFGSFRDKDKEREIKGGNDDKDDDDEDESDEEKALTGRSNNEDDVGGGHAPWIGNHFAGSMKLHSRSSLMNDAPSSSQTSRSNQGVNERGKATPYASTATYFSTVSTGVNTKEDYYGTEVKSSAVIKDEKSGEEKGASYYSFPSVTDDDDDDDYDDDKVERHYGDDILDGQGNKVDRDIGDSGGDEWKRHQRQHQDSMEEKTFMTSKPAPKGWRWSRQNSNSDQQGLLSSYSDSNDGLLSSPSRQAKKMEGFGNSDSGRSYAGITSRYGTDDGGDDVNLLNNNNLNNNQNKRNSGLFSSFRRRNNTDEQQQEEQKQLKEYVERRTGGTLESMPIRTSSFEQKNVLEEFTQGITNVAASIIAPELYSLDTMDQIVGDDAQGEYRFVSTGSDDSADEDDNVEHDVAGDEIMKLRERIVQLEKIVDEKNDEVEKWKGRVQQLEKELLLARPKENEINGNCSNVAKEANLLSFSDSTEPNEDSSTALPQSYHLNDIKGAPYMNERSMSDEEGDITSKSNEFACDFFVESSTKDTMNEGQLIDLTSPPKESNPDHVEDEFGKEGEESKAGDKEELAVMDVLGSCDIAIEQTEKTNIIDEFRDFQTGEKENDNVISVREDEELISLST